MPANIMVLGNSYSEDDQSVVKGSFDNGPKLQKRLFSPAEMMIIVDLQLRLT